MRDITSTAQKGSAFFIILIAIAMFAMLSYAVFQGGRSSQANLTSEKSKLIAQEILSFTDTVRKAVQTLRLRGCTENQISFETADTNWFHNPSAPADKSCHIFDLAGGKVVYKNMEKTWIENTDQAWWFTAQTPVQDIGSAAPELMMWITELQPEICVAINKLLTGKEPEYELIGSNNIAYTGTYNPVADNIGDDAGSIYRGQSTGCYESADDSTFYAVLLAR